MRLREALELVRDHRSSQGRRHSLGAILSLAVCAMLCGARSLYAIAQWGRDHGAPAGELLGSAVTRRPVLPPFHRVFKDLDVDAFEAVLGEWLINSGPGPGETLSLDGKTLRGIHGEGIPGVHLVSAYAARSGAVLTQVAAPPGKGAGIGGGQSSIGPGAVGGPGSGGRRPADPAGSVPADCGRRRGLPVAGEGEPAHVVPGLGRGIFPHWKLRERTGRGFPSGRRGSGGREGQR